MTDFPTGGQLRAAGANLMIGRLQADLDAMLASSWRMRLAMRLGRWTMALQQVARDIIGGILGAPRGVRRILADIDAGLLHGWRL